LIPDSKSSESDQFRFANLKFAICNLEFPQGHGAFDDHVDGFALGIVGEGAGTLVTSTSPLISARFARLPVIWIISTSSPSSLKQPLSFAAKKAIWVML
jgi:hypothetical protein